MFTEPIREPKVGPADVTHPHTDISFCISVEHHLTSGCICRLAFRARRMGITRAMPQPTMAKQLAVIKFVTSPKARPARNSRAHVPAEIKSVRPQIHRRPQRRVPFAASLDEGFWPFSVPAADVSPDNQFSGRRLQSRVGCAHVRLGQLAKVWSAKQKRAECWAFNKSQRLRVACSRCTSPQEQAFGEAYGGPGEQGFATSDIGEIIAAEEPMQAL